VAPFNTHRKTQEISEMPEKASEKENMSTVEFFCQETLRDEIAPRSVGSVQARIRKAARDLGWSYTRTKDIWYADPKISIKPIELFRVEAVSGLKFAREEMRKNDDAIERATALLGGENTHLIRAVVTAVVSALGLSHSSRA
jgi:hypothetical protein